MHVQFGGLPEQGRIISVFQEMQNLFQIILLPRLVVVFVSLVKNLMKLLFQACFFITVGDITSQFTEWLSENAPINDENFKKTIWRFCSKARIWVILKKLKGSFPMIVPRGKLSIVKSIKS